MKTIFTRETVRFDEWWGSKIPLFFALFFIYYLPGGDWGDLLKKLGLLLIWLFSAASFGYFINDCFDIKEDAQSGKRNFAGTISIVLRFGILSFLAFLTLIPWVLYGQKEIIALAVIQIAFFIIYSIPPIRLKDRAYFGVVIDAGYAFVLPAAITIILAKEQQNVADSLVFAGLVWAAVGGVRAIIVHHILKRKIDRISSIGNAVNLYGIKFNLRLLNLLLLPELVLFTKIYLTGNCVLIKAFLFLFFVSLQFIVANRKGIQVTVKRKVVVGGILFFEFYERWLLLILMASLAIRDWHFILPIFAFLLFFRLAAYYFLYDIFLQIYYSCKHLFYHILVLRTFFLLKRLCLVLFYKVVLQFYFFIRYKIITPSFLILCFNLLRPPLGFVVNYLIYVYRRIFLKLDDTSARSRSVRIPYISAFIEKHSYKPSIKKPIIFTDSYESLSIENSSDIIFQEYIINRDQNNITPDNKIVNGLWIGEELSKIEILTIESFIRNKHQFHLWTYGPLKTELPKGTVMKDANEIIPASKIFRYKHRNTFGHGKGSVSGFSDIFRYKLLYERGGWWSDMDITCLKPLNITKPYFFRKHHDLPLVGNLMKCPPGTDLMRSCYEEAIVTIDENNRDWHKPIEILSKFVFEYNLQKYIFDGFTNEDKWDEVKTYVSGAVPLPKEYLAVHWMNEEWRARGLDKSDIRFNSTLGEVLFSYSLIVIPNKKLDLYINEIRHRYWLPVYNFFYV